MGLQFDLEQRIMECWGVVDDIRIVCTRHIDGGEPLTDDEFANVMIGMEKLYDIKFYNLFSTYEKLLKEIHKLKLRKHYEDRD